jgi:hypothetical protein
VIPGGAGRRSQEIIEVSTENVLSIGEDIMVVRATEGLGDRGALPSAQASTT